MIGALRGLLLGCVATAFAGEIAAQAPRNHLYDTFQIGISGSLVIFASNVRVDSESGELGTEIDAEEVLGLAKQKIQPRATIWWRPGRRHEIEIGYQVRRRTAEKALSQTIDFRDTSFTAGADVRASFDADNAFLNYRLAFMARERAQLGAAVGLGAIFQEARIQALVSVETEGSPRTVDYEVSESFVAPTASIGLYGRFRLGDRWYIGSDLRGIAVAIDRFDIRLIEGGTSVRHFLSGGLGLECAWTAQSIRVIADPRRDGGAIEDVGRRLKYAHHNVHVGVVLVP